MNFSSLTPAQMQALLRYAGQHLGTTPEQLNQLLQSGDVPSLSARLSPRLKAELNEALRDRSKVEQWLSSPEVQALLKQPPKP